jgi:cation diffusion facilitator family transporter
VEESVNKELAALRWSAIGSLGLGALGLVFAWFTGSEAIMLDGFFSLVGFVMAVLSIKVARLVRSPGDEYFQFGYAAFEPMLNSVKGFIILTLCALAMWSAVDSVLGGGRDLQAGFAVVYALVAVVACFAIGTVQRRAARTTNSPLLEVDAKNWLIDGFMSLVVAAAFGAAIVLSGSSWSHLVPYVDPVLVIVMVVLMLPIPIRIVAGAVGELLMVAPPTELQREIGARVEAVLDEAGLQRRVIRMVRIGRVLWLLNHVLVPAERLANGVEEFDEIRGRVTDTVREVEPDAEVDTLFTAREEWLV